MYNWGLIESGYNTNYEEAHQIWLPMDYYAIDRLPSGSKNRTLSNSFIEAPLILSYKNPINIGDELFININAFEIGNLKIEVFNLNGQLVKEEEFIVKDLGPYKFILNNLNVKNEINIIKITLNNKYFDCSNLAIQHELLY